MGTSLQGIMNMSQLSLTNNQTALTIMCNNVANMNNEDYSKQNVKISAIKTYNSYGCYYSKGGMQIGQGAHITEIYRNREQWLDNYFRDQNTKSGYFEQLKTMTNDIENLLNDELSSTGLQKRLTAFFSSAQSLTAEPTNTAYRIAYVEAAEDVADYFNEMSATIKGDRKQLVGDVNDPESLESSTLNLSLKELNNKLEQLAKINGDIAQSYASGSASCNLLDARDKILDEITQFIPVTITTNENLTVNIYLDNKALVKAGDQKVFFDAVQGDEDTPAIIRLMDKKYPDDDPIVSNANDMITGGSIKAMLDAGGPNELSYKYVLNEIDKLANAFATELNKIQMETWQENGVDSIPYCISNGVLTLAEEPFFELLPAGTDYTAENIKINKNLLNDPSLIATARGTADIEDTPAIGNAVNLGLVNKLQTEGLASLQNGGTKQTLDSFIKNLVTSVGSQIEGLNSSATVQANLLEQADAKRGSITGVNLNEELADLIKFQRSYEASARVFTTASQLMETIVNLGR